MLASAIKKTHKSIENNCSLIRWLQNLHFLQTKVIELEKLKKKKILLNARKISRGLLKMKSKTMVSSWNSPEKNKNHITFIIQVGDLKSNKKLLSKFWDSFEMNHSQQYHYKGLDADMDEYLSEYKNQTPLDTDDYAGEWSSIICNFSSSF